MIFRPYRSACVAIHIINFSLVFIGYCIVSSIMMGDCEKYIIIITSFVFFLEFLLSLIVMKYYYSPLIFVDSRGVKRVYGGKIINDFKWKEINTISKTSNDSWSAYVYISNKSKRYTSNTFKLMRDYDTLFVHMSLEFEEAILHFGNLDYDPNSLNYVVKKDKFDGLNDDVARIKIDNILVKRDCHLKLKAWIDTLLFIITSVLLGLLGIYLICNNNIINVLSIIVEILLIMVALIDVYIGIMHLINTYKFLTIISN